MDCPQIPTTNGQPFRVSFARKAAQERIPISGGLAFTHRCNLRCVHCYLGDERTYNAETSTELTTAQWHTIIDDITEAGCLSLFITGGEPLLRRDFAELYRHLKTNGIILNVFTNGTLISDEITALFQEWPPQGIEVSLYGATAATYERITGVPGSYQQCLRGIQRLVDAQIRVTLKTMLMTLNIHEFEMIQQMASSYGVTFRHDAALFPILQGDRAPLALRVPPQDAVAKDFDDPERLRQFRELLVADQRMTIADNALYHCGAGRFSFHVDAHGDLLPCILSTQPRYALATGSFIIGWQNVMPAITAKRADDAFACHHCDKRQICVGCPAFFHLETGDEKTPSNYICALSQERLHRLR